ncbi:hypothetical protein B0A55_06310 [Friedmanniomyces simplex]|uniref:Uncharacterized protein n=1 Tax=Friedmanniomyces simplex TaxID=329884 RepID=A0A4U0XGF8_9PEZI|nr:hypothetical protein B0A55_06310 [Friedmanniomyces simplex]
MLEFVHLSGAEAGKDLQTRRKVRSQAMRDFRRRQREEQEKSDGVLLNRQASPEEIDLQVSEGSHEPIGTRQFSSSGFQIQGYFNDQQSIPSVKVAGSVYN